jgi:hypothetical protein
VDFSYRREKAMPYSQTQSQPFFCMDRINRGYKFKNTNMRSSDLIELLAHLVNQIFSLNIYNQPAMLL